MVIRVLDLVPRCYTAAEGLIIRDILQPALGQGDHVVLSFDGVNDTPSSFINAAIASLVDFFDADYIKSHLKVVDSNSQINDMIKRCLRNAERHLSAA